MGNQANAGNFQAFLDKCPDSAPFCFWVGFTEPHRKYEDGAGVRAGKKLSEIEVPGFLPDSEQVRSDIADYAYEIGWYDGQVAAEARPGRHRRPPRRRCRIAVQRQTERS
jgi:N-sulfoglucosamine sulfohydrolase